MCPMKEYILRCQSIIADYISNRPIYELCMGEERMPGPIIFMQLWYKDLNLEEEGGGANEETERGLGWHGENCSSKYLCRDSSLTNFSKGGALVHTP